MVIVPDLQAGDQKRRPQDALLAGDAGLCATRRIRRDHRISGRAHAIQGRRSRQSQRHGSIASIANGNRRRRGAFSTCRHPRPRRTAPLRPARLQRSRQMADLALVEPSESLLATAWPALEEEVRARFEDWKARKGRSLPAMSK